MPTYVTSGLTYSLFADSVRRGLVYSYDQGLGDVFGLVLKYVSLSPILLLDGHI